jgi:hypothetical protein
MERAITSGRLRQRSLQQSTESTPIESTQANRSIIPTGYKDAPQ